jgi:hypothetical protein
MDPQCVQLPNEWRRALAGDGQARAYWQTVEGGPWSWEGDAVRVRAGGSEWSAYQYSRCDAQLLRALQNFVVEVTVVGSAMAAGLSFGSYMDFLAELEPHRAPRRLRLHVDTVADVWTFFIDGRRAERCWWDAAVRNTSDLVEGCLTLKARGVDNVLFENLVIRGA